MKNGDVVKEIKGELPEDSRVEDVFFEGANIVLYTKNRNFFLDSKDSIRNIVNKVKKRIELRMDPSMILEPDATQDKINEIVPKEAGVGEAWFDYKRSLVIIEADKPGLVIGKEGHVMNKIKEETLWTPKVRRAPVIKSDLIKTIRHTLFQNSEYRRDFMNKIGRKIYLTKWKRDQNYWIRLSCLGGFREVGRSCMLVQTPLSNVMLDCGLNVASFEKSFPHFDAPEFDINKLDAVVISHAHLDHSGSLPLLYKYGYQGPVYYTEPTRDISTLLQLDYIDVIQRQGKKPEYSSREVRELIKNSITLEFDEVTDITPDIRLTLHNAGHVLGSSMIHLNIGEGFHNMLYTGDYKFGKSKLLEASHIKFQRLETVITESTYGAKEDIQPTREESENFLIQAVKNTLDNKGKALIPVLGVGRAQDVILILEQAIREKKIPEVDVFIDGMVWDVTAIHTTYPEFMNREVKKQIFGQDVNPFVSTIFSRVGSQSEREEIINKRKPCIIIATSGMLTGGSSVEYFRNLAENKKNAIIFVSYQAEGSLGRRIQKGEKSMPVETFGGKTEMVTVELDVYSVEGLSGHSDRNQLINFIKRLEPRPRRIIFNHGESSKCLEMASSIHKQLRIETTAPRNLEVVRIR
ncbi:MAG TPA: beta-CASP ribonuclease aCPSF1 [Candidatus Woesearchaeota archaeon]|nr:beta-CASP ribonuclease aCPSF1 [Candidatus Woesearchaeota archaeon]